MRRRYCLAHGKRAIHRGLDGRHRGERITGRMDRERDRANDEGEELEIDLVVAV